jgi:hypothetical protein
MGLDVNIVCRNFESDRVIPRFSRYLSDILGWELTSRPIMGAVIYYLSAYFEYQLIRNEISRSSKMAAYFTHKEENPPNNAKARLFDRVGGLVDLRIITALMYSEDLINFGDTVQINPPVERSSFVIPNRKNKKMVAGFSGYTYSNKRKGERLAKAVINSDPGKKLEWRASGRGWPVLTKKYPWRDLPGFYQSLDILVVTASVEGVPMPPLEILSCGGSVVIPRGVGLLDELPDLVGIHRYKKGDEKSLSRALSEAMEARSRVDREALRDVTAPYSILAWCEQHRDNFEEVFS